MRQLLGHQANTDRGLTAEEFFDSEHAALLLAPTRPDWRPGAAFVYHALTIGRLVEELVRRVMATTIQHLYEQRVRAVRTIDFYLGIPPEQEQRYVPLRPADAVLDAGPSTTFLRR